MAKERCATECRKSADCDVADLYFYRQYSGSWSLSDQACTLINKTEECDWDQYHDGYRHVFVKGALAPSKRPTHRPTEKPTTAPTRSPTASPTVARF